MATITVRPLIEFETWPVGISQAATPANWNALRAEVIARPAVGFQASQPGSPLDGDLYVLSGDWGNTYFDLDNNEITNPAGLLAYFRDGAWSFWQPFHGLMKRVGLSFYEYHPDSGTTWQLFAIPSSAPLIVESGTSRDLLLSDIGAYVRWTSTSAKTLNVLDDSTEPIAVEAEFHHRNAAAGDLTINPSGGVTIHAPSGGTLVIPEGGTFTLKKVAADEWDLFGVTVAV